MSEVRTIKGPCFDCDDANDFGCVCRFFPDSDLACPCHGSVRDTAPVAKVRPRNAAQRAAEDDVMQIKWTDERPTEPGDYWLSLPKHKRGPGYNAVLDITLKFSCGLLGVHDHAGNWITAVISTQLDGAKWSRRETPADPFEEVKA